MKFFGFFLVIAGTIGGYTLSGGHLAAVLHALPFEGMTIIGCAVGAFIIANTKHTIKATIKNLNCLVTPEAHNKESYLELLSVLYMLFKLARTKGWLALESHIETPQESELFKQFPGFYNDHDALVFLCDYLRIISLGNEDPHEIGALMDEEIESLETDKMHPAHAVQTMADGIPALGIVAAVLGVIKTMGAITEPPEILGHMIGGALCGTFLGVWLAYGFVGPTGGALKAKADSEVMYYRCLKVAILAFLNGAAPQVAVEFARKFLPHHIQPKFLELEDKLNELPSPS
jgi:chemotaxis protein MotA